jgi:hypothetical protein
MQPAKMKLANRLVVFCQFFVTMKAYANFPIPGSLIYSASDVQEERLDAIET